MKKLATIFFLFLSSVCRSQSQHIRFEKIGTKEGLSSQQTTCLFQDSHGFIWIGTTFGLNRFDGISCKTYYHDRNDSNSLVHNLVLSIVQDKEHNLWIGTQEGVSCLNITTGNFVNYSAAGKGIYYLPREYVYTYVDKDDNVWIGHNAGVSVIKDRHQSPTNIPLQLNQPGRSTNNFVTSFLHDSKDRLWVTTSYGIRLINRKIFSVTEYKLDPNTGANTCLQLAEDSKGRIFAGTWGLGVLLFDEKKNIFYPLQVTKDPYSLENIVHSILPVTQNGIDYLFLGSDNGLIKIKTQDLLDKRMKFDISKPDRLDPESLTGHAVLRLMEDRTGNIWMATKGINKIDPHKQGFQTYAVSTDLNFQNAPVVLCGDTDNADNIWMGMGRLYSYNKQDNQFRPVNTIADFWVVDIIRGKEFYWLATGSGLVQCNKKMQPVKTWGKGNKATDLNTAGTYSLCEDHEGKIWIGTAKHGINVLDPVTGIIEKFLDDSVNIQANPYINDIIEDGQHNIWIGTTDGLYRFNRSKNAFESFRLNTKPEYNALSDNILCIKETKEGKIYIGSRQGLRYYDYSTNTFIQVPFTGNHLSDFISGIVEDTDGMLWLGTNSGMIQYNPVNNSFKVYNSNNGLDDNNATYLFDNDSENNIYIGSSGKLTVFNPKQLMQNQFAPAPLITDVFIDNNAVSFGNMKAISLKHNQGISFNFVSLNYTNPENNTYAYRLAGLNNDWVNIGNNRNILFPGLSPGRYTLNLKAANNDGVWNEEITSFNFIVTPPFWKTWWFISLMLILVAASVYVFYRYRLNQLLRMEKMRTRIATDLHDDIGATLSSISFYSEAVKQKAKEKLPEVTITLEKMGETSRQMVTSMSDIVWAINPQNDDMEKMFQRMHSYAVELCAVKNVSLQVEADEKISSLKPKLEQRKNIYLVFKEALNNALKYSQCDTIRLILKQNGSMFIMRIADNGKGFDTAMDTGGNGLQNMRRRASEIDGSLNIVSALNGTTVELVVRIT